MFSNGAAFADGRAGGLYDVHRRSASGALVPRFDDERYPRRNAAHPAGGRDHPAVGARHSGPPNRQLSSLDEVRVQTLCYANQISKSRFGETTASTFHASAVVSMS